MLTQWLSEYEQALFVLQFDFAERWAPDSVQRLALLVHKQGSGAPRFSIVPAAVWQQTETIANAELRFDEAVARAVAPSLLLGAPLRLDPVIVPKPWGREIWYTGIEQRGVSRVGDGNRWFSLSWLLSALPQYYGDRPPVLLKILDPLPDEVFGDLYFELHCEKREVYVVTHVDDSAWPEGEGAIRYGFDPEVRVQYTSDEAFRQAFLQAVEAYESVRREIDAELDQCRAEAGVAMDEPVPASRIKEWLGGLSGEILQRERRLRADMEAFTALKPLRVGDVVQVPLLTPHSLQHGVRTVEFQTPVYERLILSFAQKVLTQSYWDTAEAVSMMRVASPDEPELPELRRTADWSEQQIVDFDDFEARRLQLHQGAECELPGLPGGGVAMAIGAEVRVQDELLKPEQAVLLPCNQAVQTRAEASATLLWAQPRLC